MHSIMPIWNADFAEARFFEVEDWSIRALTSLPTFRQSAAAAAGAATAPAHRPLPIATPQRTKRNLRMMLLHQRNAKTVSLSASNHVDLGQQEWRNSLLFWIVPAVSKF